MSKIIMMKGLPASGKSTKAKEIMDSGGNFVRLNRDLLRTMLHFDKWTGRNEKLTVEAMKTLARHYLGKGVNIIVDDTNLGERHKTSWEGIAQETGSKFEIEEMDTLVSLCVARDSQRENSVGEHVILSMALQYGMYPQNSLPFVLCDIDGTVADCSHRQHYVRGEKKDWKSFFDEMHKDTPRTEIIEQIQELEQKGYPIIFVSARPDDYRQVTQNWLQANVGVDYQLLIMRRAGDKRPDTMVKEDILRNFFLNPGNDIYKVFDDRPSVIRMWRKHGIEVVDVGNGEEF